MPAKVEKITESVELGEGPHWDVATQSLYFVDIFGKAIYKYNPSAERLTKAVIGTNHVTFIPGRRTKKQIPHQYWTDFGDCHLGWRK
jgi:sugar lactone lactonase YvrE